MRQPETGPGIFYGLYLLLAEIATGILLMIRGLSQRAKAARLPLALSP